MKKGKLVNRAYLMMLLLVSVFCMVAVIMSILSLPEQRTEIQHQHSWEDDEIDKHVQKLSKFGEMMVEMLPHDVAFTVFVPSDRAFEYILKLTEIHSFDPEEWDNTYATVSRVLGFSAVPQKINADSIPVGKVMSFDSISGLGLYTYKDWDGTLVVNGVRSEMVDIRRGEVVVHILEDVLMDHEFENSVWLGDDEQGGHTF